MSTPTAPDLAGHQIRCVRPMTVQEALNEQWTGQTPPVVLELDDGAIVYAATAATTASNPGVLYGQTAGGRPFALHATIPPDPRQLRLRIN